MLRHYSDRVFWLVSKGFSEEVVFKLKQRVGGGSRGWHIKGKVYAKAKKMEEIGQGDGTLKAKGKVVQEEAGEIGSARWWRLLKVTWRNGKPVKDYKQRSDMTRLTMPIISPSPLIFAFSVSEQPMVMESHVTRVTITSGNSCCPISTDCPFTHPLSTLNCTPLTIQNISLLGISWLHRFFLSSLCR